MIELVKSVNEEDGRELEVIWREHIPLFSAYSIMSNAINAGVTVDGGKIEASLVFGFSVIKDFMEERETNGRSKISSKPRR